MDPASAIGLVSALASLASGGIKLAKTLNIYYEKFRQAGKDVKRIADEVESTSNIFMQLGINLEFEKEDPGMPGLFTKHIPLILKEQFASRKSTRLRAEVLIGAIGSLTKSKQLC